MEHLHFWEAASVEVDASVFTSLVDALSNRRAIEIDYYSASSDRRYEGRRVDPWGPGGPGRGLALQGLSPFSFGELIED